MVYKQTGLILPEDLACLSFQLDKSVSKKDRAVRAAELQKLAQAPLSNFFEEKLSYMLDDKKPNPLMRGLFVSLASTG